MWFKKRKIKKFYALEEGKTYWITIGDKNNVPTRKEIERIDYILKRKNPKIKFIVSDYLIKPYKIKSKKKKKKD